jgi:peptide/nickel transport system ATP-binding protein
MALLSVVDLAKRFEGRPHPAVEGVTFDIEPRETLAIVGRSGSGKSTIARLITRLIAPTAGRILFDGRDITHATRGELLSVRKRMQILFQDPGAALDPRMTVEQAVREPLHIHDAGRNGSERNRVEEFLRLVHLDAGLISRYPHELSGGQKQRVQLARALAVRPELLVMDEPLSALDVLVGAELLELLAALRESLGTAYVLISHDLRAVRHFASRVAVLHRGRIVEMKETEALFRSGENDETRLLLGHLATSRNPG